VRSRLRAPAELADLVVAHKVADGTLELDGNTILVAGWRAEPTPAQAKLLDALAVLLDHAGSEPPSVEELSATVGSDAEPLLRYLERQGRIIQVEQGRYYDAANLKLLIDRLRAGLADGSERSPAELREILGFSRKFLIPFLEYCVRSGHTMRTAMGRIWHGK